ncbi:hypothetical protein SELMODRAFT_410223 [Selaginella moellendorffii]|uniref:SAP domain-containing protein n=1 Tax=Selaginella moellendorffii TaxID=88036 RepID=D8RE16_SELML|nr:hypothetical protein SELMODRAFT_410223 [Selaginella moellendorffii]
MAVCVTVKSTDGVVLGERKFKRPRVLDYLRDAYGRGCLLDADGYAVLDESVGGGQYVYELVPTLQAGPTLEAAPAPVPPPSVVYDLRPLWERVREAKLAVVTRKMRTELVTAAVTTDFKREETRNAARMIQDSRTVSLTTLTLPEGITFMDSQISIIMIRKVYIFLAQAALTMLKDSGKHMQVKGTPGTGKTVFGFYLFYKLRMDPVFSNWTIIWEQGSKHGPGTSYYFRANELLQGKTGDFDRRITKDTVFLVNGPEATLRMVQNKAHVIFFMSTKDSKDCMWQFEKDTDLVTFYMPLWDLCELLLAAPLAGHGDCSEAAVRERYQKFGGSVRSVLVRHNNPNYICRFARALNTAKDKARIMYRIGSMLHEKDVSSFILHLKVVSTDLKDTMVVFASQYVEEQLSLLEEEEATQRAIEYIRQNQGIKDERILVGKRFEHLVHQLFRSDAFGNHVFQARRLHKPISIEELRSFLRRRDLPVRERKAALIQRLKDADYEMEEWPVIEDKQDMEDEVEPEDEVDEEVAAEEQEAVRFNCQGKFQTFKSLDEIDPKSRGYFKPDARNNPLFDSIILLGDGHALQVTINDCHQASAKYIDELIKRYNLKRFYFVVPQEMLESYPYQKLVLGLQEVSWPCELWVLGVRWTVLSTK